MESKLYTKARSLCCSLLPSPWCDLSPEDIEIEPITTGRSNRLFICTIKSSDSHIDREIDPSSSSLLLLSSSPSPTASSLSPVTCSLSSSSEEEDDHSEVTSNGKVKRQFSNRRKGITKHVKVIVRFYGSELTGEGNRYKCVSDEEELKILDILSARGMSPTVLTSFPGGRIDEFIESTTLVPKQLGQPDILTLLAPKIAQYHATPFKCERLYDLVQIFEENSSQVIKLLSTYDEINLQDRSQSSILLLRKIKNFFTGKPADQLTRKFIATKQRAVFVHFDLNYTNFLFLKSEVPSKSYSPLDVMIIDVENSANNFRGIDLGKFFAELCVGYDDTDDLYYISDSAIEKFVDCYLKEWKSIVDPSQLDPEIDNQGHLALELQIGFLFNTIFNMAWNVLHPHFGSNRFLHNTAKRIDVFNHYNQRWSHII